jgi:3-oxoacyl-[acyl-carrier protein] reductase
MKIEGAVALVTGGSEGIGEGIARALAAKGAAVTITGRREDKLRTTAEALGVDHVVGDVGVEEDAVRTVAEVVENHGRLDLLVNNAGFGTFGMLVDTELAELERVYRTNVFGAFLMGREAARRFIAQGTGGHLVNISSTSGLKGGPGATVYCSSKFALRGMTECWREELRRHDIRVMLVNPSEVQTPFFDKLGMEREFSEKKLRPDEIASAIVGALEIDDRGFIPELSVFATNPF